MRRGLTLIELLASLAILALLAAASTAWVSFLARSAAELSAAANEHAAARAAVRLIGDDAMSGAFPADAEPGRPAGELVLATRLAARDASPGGPAMARYFLEGGVLWRSVGPVDDQFADHAAARRLCGGVAGFVVEFDREAGRCRVLIRGERGWVASGVWNW